MANYEMMLNYKPLHSNLNISRFVVSKAAQMEIWWGQYFCHINVKFHHCSQRNSNYVFCEIKNWHNVPN